MTRRISIFGASGATGLVLIQEAVARGHEVKASIRSEAAQAKLPSGVAVVVGNLLDREAVARTIEGTDAVICVIGPRPGATEPFCAAATRNIIDAMKAQGVRRLICQTGAMIGDYPHLSWFMRTMRNSYRKQQPRLAADRAEQESLVTASGLDWTVVKPPRLTDGPARGRVQSGESLKVGAMSNISRLDLGKFILEELGARAYIGKRLVVQS